ncbi:MAG TPA: DUF4157 domain-containing protein [Thermoanaerobaculia bacterium]|nr:DUF4157 domain-containing protein [Thermoanaerobaculia bacterium]
MNREPGSAALAGALERVRGELERSGARVRIGFPAGCRLLMGSRVFAITLGRRIFLAPELLSQSRERIVATLRHELVHVDQVLRLGLIRFLAIYLRDYLRGRLAGRSHLEAYRAIPFEREAFGSEEGPVAPFGRSPV